MIRAADLSKYRLQDQVDWVGNTINWEGYGEATDADGFAQRAATLYADQSPWEQSQRIGDYCISSASLPVCACAPTAHNPPKLIGSDVLTQALTCCSSVSAETAGLQL